jgi:hypothetical protein
MNHFINLIGIDDRILYIAANQIIGFTRHDHNITNVQLFNNTVLPVKTPPEIIECRINEYLDNLLKFKK